MVPSSLDVSWVLRNGRRIWRERGLVLTLSQEEKRKSFFVSSTPDTWFGGYCVCNYRLIDESFISNFTGNNAIQIHWSCIKMESTKTTFDR